MPVGNEHGGPAQQKMLCVVERNAQPATRYVDDVLTGVRAIDSREGGDNRARTAAARLGFSGATLVHPHDGVPLTHDVDELDVDAFGKRQHIDVRHGGEI
jgi:hypothetical protein